jgi:polyhydroxyalkanoate synthase
VDLNSAEAMKYLEQQATQFNQLVKDALTRHMGGTPEEFPPIFDTEAMLDTLSKGAKVDTNRLIQEQKKFMEKHAELWQNVAKAMSGEAVAPVIKEARGDRRFKDEEWNDNPVFNYLKQSYLLNGQMMQNLVESFEFEDSKTAERIQFYTRQYVNSMSPTNYALTNPEVCREIIATEGKNLTKGMENYARDLERSPADAFRITQTDEDAFTLGENLASTPGKVVFQNDLMQLIQYTPTTKKVYKTPLLIVPPFINKYYILDLNEKQSIPRWLVSQGYTVFIVSWVNPNQSLADKSFGDYSLEGPVAALDAIQAITGEDKINVAGYCVGGTLLSATQAYLLAKGDTRINSLTFFTTLMDFEKPGEVSIYLSEDTAPLLIDNARNKGVFDGRVLGLSFSMLRENNLFWSYFINNYLKGQDPAPFDILYWNSDPTNLTPETFCQYIENTYIGNKLIEPGAVIMNGVPIDLSTIDTPTYFVSTMSDHIVPWKSSYRGTQILSGPKRFVLAGSGHIAGVINPADGGKYPHWVNDALPATAEQWFEDATEQAGSWWPDWHNWLKPQSGKKTAAARQPGAHTDYPALEDAPGSYVKVRI